jgi:hypothetical protein
MSDDSHYPETRAGDLERLGDAARQARETSHSTRDEAARTRWRSAKARLRARRARGRARALGPRTLDEFVEVASVDDLVHVLVDLAEGDDDKRHDDGRRRNG